MLGQSSPAQLGSLLTYLNQIMKDMILPPEKSVEDLRTSLDQHMNPMMGPIIRRPM